MNFKMGYINDPYFLKWIFQPDTLTDQYWASYLEKHPEEKEMITSLKEELTYLKLKNEELSDQEKVLLLQKILKKKSQSENKGKFRQLGRNISRYAAVAVIFLIIGNIIMYLYLTPKKSEINFAGMEYNIPADEPRLILSDGSDIKLKDNSDIQYLKEDKVIVDNDSVKVSLDNKNEAVSNQLIIPGGSRAKITLCDNTVVHLNAGSKLIYPSVFTGKTRDVLLFGEAYFDVSKNEDTPFMVRTSSLTVKVFGTKFNISSYSEDNIVQTVLVEGKVSIKRNDAPFYEQGITMHPNQLVTYNKKTKVLNTAEVDTEYYTIWKDGMLKFEDQDLNRIIKKLERFYNLTINFQDPLKGSIKISGKLDLNENKYEVFEYLSTLTKMEFKEINEKYYIMK
jgi:ferric-dicitrate binding protein FerR (iron transport regulator)